jgi:outer membrane receptor for ferrienterochelin and colicins
MKNYIVLYFLFLPFFTFGQLLEGSVRATTTNEPLIGATLHWLGATSSGVSTDNEGKFSIKKATSTTKLVVSYIGYSSDTIEIASLSFIEIFLKNSSETLQEITVKGQSAVFDKLSPMQSELLTTKTLAKAACCNLSESFETNASVSVSYTDAVTGAKQIQLLGLGGNYVQTNLENIPSIRGLATTFGLNYVPGTWIQSIDIGKGAGSVVNGYESMTGAINVELMKPDNSEKLYLNFYANSLGRGEGNLNFSHKLNQKWSVGVLSHGSFLSNKIDKNGDNFLDTPTYGQLNIMNRWKYSTEKMMAQIGVRALTENRIGGQMAFKNRQETPLNYGFTNDTKRFEFFSKIAKLFPKTPYRGLGWIVNATHHESDSYFGFKNYIGIQKSLYSNLIYQDIFKTTEHTYKIGTSYLLDSYDEKYASFDLQKTENVLGFFGEYTYNHLDKTVVVLGLRTDFHSLFGVFNSPRIHVKHDLTQTLTWRISAGKGYRIPNRLAESYGNLVSSRQVVFLDKLTPEISWNFGTSLTKEIGKSTLIFDIYRTTFQQKLIVDAEHPTFLYFYNSEGKTFSTSAQAELNYVPHKNWEMKLAYRFVDMKQTMGKPNGEQVLLPVMFVNRDRILVNVGYALPYDKWKMDITYTWNGKRRIPDAIGHSSYEKMPSIYAKGFSGVNAQITRTFINWEIYLGGENLTNFRQQNPIFGANEPFGTNFDAGMAWGPILGSVIYSGVRYKIR